jgi:hypothetical protein
MKYKIVVKIVEKLKYNSELNINIVTESVSGHSIYEI